MPPHLENESSQVPVTALASAWSDLTLAGQGPYLKIYAIASSELLLTEKIFVRQAIHGFAKQPRSTRSNLSLVLWGGRNVCFCEVTREDSNKVHAGINISIEYKSVVQADDWIFDAIFRPFSVGDTGQETSIVLVTANNELLELKVLRGEQDHGLATKKLQLEALFRGPRCGLYSATLGWISSTRLLIASGTAFGEIVLWSFECDENKVVARRHYIFTGHEGSVFGIRLSDEIILHNGRPLRALASCSDDRTIRLWDISDLSSGITIEQHDLEEQDRDELRTTGFLNYVSEEAAAASKSLCIASAMGHISRIWNVRFVTEEIYERSKRYVSTIISVGEDATCQKWHLNYIGSEEGAFALNHVAIDDYHAGKNIWSSFTNGSSVVTGGADGKIVQHSSLLDSEGTNNQHILLREFDVDDVATDTNMQQPAEAQDITHQNSTRASAAQTTRRKRNADCFRSFACIGSNQLLMATNDGSILLATRADGYHWTWKHLAFFDGLKGYSVAARLTAEPFEYVFFGDGHGTIYYYHSFFEVVKVLTDVGAKITKLMPEILPRRTHEYMSIVVTRQGGKPPVQLRVNLGFGGNLHLSTTKVFERWREDSPPITSCAVATHDSFQEKALILGCRNGSIISYSSPDSTRRGDYDFELPHSHGKEAVTAMVWLPRKNYPDNGSNECFGWLFSVGRDGTLAVHQFPGHYGEPVLVHKLSLSFGPNLEGLAIDPRTADVFVWGFTSKFFVCQNVSAMQDVVSIECGGAHRLWAFGPLDPVGGIFAWVKALKLNITKIAGESHKVIQHGHHGREIKACDVTEEGVVPGLGPLIATGAEDTNISISYYADWHGTQKELRQLAVLRKHVTGIQALKWLSKEAERSLHRPLRTPPKSQFLFSCGGFEEFYVWHLRAMPAVGVGVVCESRCPPSSEGSELRITDFAVKDVSQQHPLDPDVQEWTFLISMVYSDSSIKVWKYTSSRERYPDREPWSLVAKAQYSTACLTTAEYLSRTPNGWPLVTGATDGHLAFWSLTSGKERLTCHQIQSLHQSSIKSMAATELTDTLWLVVTGGDDNALGLTLLRSEDEGSSFTSLSVLVPRAHAAAVTAVGFVKTQEEMGFSRSIALNIVTASCDQMVKIWEVMTDLRRSGARSISIRKVAEHTSAVADVSSLTAFRTLQGPVDVRRSKILICGAGQEVWSYHDA